MSTVAFLPCSDVIGESLVALRVSMSLSRQEAIAMASNEQTSRRIASLASRALNDPASLTFAEIQELGGSCLTQARDKDGYDRLAKLLAGAPGAHAVYGR